MWGGAVMAGYQAEYSKQGYGCYADMSLPSPLISF